jgi:Leucine-rich repeat (LRR) protein
MHGNWKSWVYSSYLVLLAGVGYSQPLAITEITHSSSNVVGLGWVSTSSRYIVAQSPDLTAGSFQYMGPVVSANQTVLTNNAPASFFQVREVAVIDFPDPNLRRAVTNAIVNWYEPRSLVYDIEMSGITALYCASLGITNESGLQALSDLSYLSCENNQFPGLDLTGGTNLSILLCYNNALTNLALTGCTSLGILSCYSNQLPSLDLSDCTNLNWLSCWANQLTELNVAGLAQVTDLDCSDNALSSLDLAGCVRLSILYCYSNRLSGLSLPGFTRLTELDCSENQLTNLMVAGSPSLAWLSCWGNQLPNLEVSGLGRLSALDCSVNPLTSLSLSGCTNLTVLYCYSNQLTNLAVEDCLRLTLLDCSHNQLTDLATLVTNAVQGGLGAGDTVWLSGNPLSSFAVTNQIPILQAAGVTVNYP